MKLRDVIFNLRFEFLKNHSIQPTDEDITQAFLAHFKEMVGEEKICPNVFASVFSQPCEKCKTYNLHRKVMLDKLEDK